ncbi:MAG: hypothetical protein J0L75_06840 [Spirochaetes bacterium]|nr:hypothetical protein [Spirochaetota bacterium]
MKIVKIVSVLFALTGFGIALFYAGYRVGERRGVLAGGCGAVEGRGCSPEFRAYSARGQVQSAQGSRLLVLDRGRWEKELILSASTRIEGWGSPSEIREGDHLFAAGRPLSNGQMEVSLIRKMAPGMGGMHRR